MRRNFFQEATLLAAGSGVARLRLDHAEHGARIKRVGFLTKEMDFQLICAAPTKSMAALMDVFNRRISFSKAPAAGSPTWIDEVDLEQQRIAEIYEEHRLNTVRDVKAKFELANPFKTDIGEAAE